MGPAVSISLERRPRPARKDRLDAYAGLVEHLAIVSSELHAWVESMVVAADLIEEDRPCRAVFDQLASRNPARLLAWLRDETLDDHLLTFAAESAGRVPAEFADDARRSLIDLLRHPRAYVREGAVYGLAELPLTDETVQALNKRVDPSVEPSPGVRDAAADSLDAMD